MNHSILRRFVPLTFVVLAVGSVAQAVVLDIQANVTADVRELAGGSILNSDHAFNQLDLTTHALPLVAEARLLPPGAAQTTTVTDVAADATARFSDPRVNQTESPNEFALSAIGFSADVSSSVNGDSVSVETRQVVFQADEVGIAADTPVTARSHFFLDGILILLAPPGAAGLAGATTELDITVTQTRTGQDPATVLQATVVLTGNADGTAALTVNGALVADNVVTFGASGATAAGGVFQAAVLSNLAIPYEYPANVGETFQLQAQIEAKCNAAPGTGGAIILGDQINQLVSVLEGVLGQDVVSGIATGLTTGLSGVSLPLKPLVATEQDTVVEAAAASGQALPLFNGRACGLMGVESMLLAAGLTIMGLAARKKM